MSDAQKLKDALERYKEAQKALENRLKTAANQIRQVRQEQAEK